jgi:uncharacterized membrane protein
MVARISRAAVIASALMGPLSALGNPPSFQGLGVGTYVSDLSGDGRVAVGSIGAGQASAAFRWEAGVLSYLDGYPSGAYLVSQDGSVIVGSADGQRVRWIDGVVTPMGGLDGYDLLILKAASADGSVVVGTGRRQRPLEFSAFRWFNGTVESIGEGAGLWMPTDTTADGATVVGFGGGGGFRWNNGVRTPVCIDPGDANTIVLGVSNNGSIMIGTRATIQTPPPWLATSPSGAESSNGYSFYRWVNDVPEPIGELPGGTPGAPYTISVELSGDGSTIVGTVSPLPFVEWDPNWGSPEATTSIWRAGLGWRELQDVLVNECHLDLTGWTLITAVAVSDDGQTIVGNGLHTGMQTEAWIAHIPEPTAALLLPSLFGLCRRRQYGVRRHRRRFGWRGSRTAG